MAKRVIGAMLLFILALGLSACSGVSTPGPTVPVPPTQPPAPTAEPTATTPPVPITYDEIKAQRKALTDVQWEEYKKTIPGKLLSGSGFVYDVKQAMFDDKNYDVQITLDDPNKPLDTYELLFTVPAADATKFTKKQAIDFSGPIKKVEICIADACTLSLENSTTYTLK